MPTSHEVKRNDCIRRAVRSKMNIDRGRIYRLMTKERFDCQQVNTIFVQMCTESMAQGMTGNTLLPTEGALYFVNVAG